MTNTDTATETVSDLDRYTANIVAVYRSATPEQIAQGMAWYADAAGIAADFSRRYGYTLDQCAGVIAALSPMNSWGNNVRLAERFLKEGGLTSGYLTKMLAKGRAILGGAPLADVLTSNKISAFAECILSAGNTRAVCVDRHAQDIALDIRHTDSARPALGKRAYALIADAYRAAGDTLGVSPARVQAITWVTWRRRYWSEGAFDLAK
jgi:hypothetical protein